MESQGNISKILSFFKPGRNEKMDDAIGWPGFDDILPAVTYEGPVAQHQQ